MNSRHMLRSVRPWELIDGKTVRIAGQAMPLAEVRDCVLRESYEPNVIGHLAALGLFLAVGCAFVLPVVMSLARPKMLVGGALFIGLGVTLIMEIWKLRGIHLFHVEVRMQDGRAISFTSAERAEAQALAAALRQGGAR